MTEKSKATQPKGTPQERADGRRLTGKEAESVELNVEELEERIAPMKTF